MENLFAAIQNGADAVYLGGKLFNARHYASNFDNEELKFAVEYAHLRNVKVYVTVNILIDDGEMNKALDYIKYLYESNVDGIIVQDLGLAYLIKNIFPDMDLHASTQMTINNQFGAIFLEKYGFKRVVLARETPLEEIKRIHESTKIELEGFIHGALCVCYSGQCLMSSIIGGRSGNRGECAQPCRLPYSIIDFNKGSTPFNDWNNKYLLSPRDLNTLEDIEKIVESGIYSLKIEGRMKRPEYVAVVVNNYRKVLDEGITALRDQDREDILQIFNRGFTKGFPLGDFGRKFASYDRPDNRGIYIGKIVKRDSRYLYIKLDYDVEKGDGIELETTRGRHIGQILNFSALKGSIVKIDRIKKVPVGSKVYRTSSINLLERAKKSYEGDKIKFPIHMEVNISIGKPAELIIRFNGESFKIQSDFLVEKGKKVALTKERVIEQLSKLNDTVYYIDSIKVNLEDCSFMPISVINSLRREGIEILDNIRKNFNKRSKITDEEYKARLDRYFRTSSIEKKNAKRISISVLRKEQFEQLDLKKLDRVYIGFDEGLKEAILEIKKENKEVYLLTDRILYGEDLFRLKERIDPIKDLIDGVSIDNLGTLQFVKDNFNLNMHGDIGLNTFNSFTVEALKDSGLSSITLSPELNMEQIKGICEKSSMYYETIGYGYLKLMITKHCPMALLKNCKDGSKCKSCPYAKGYGLKDRKGVNFYMERDKGLTTIYNSVPLMVLDSLDHIYKCGVDMIRLDFTIENEGINELQEIYYNFAKSVISKNEVESFIKDYKNINSITKGHYFRGVI
ncbi:MAG: U32 family peptidase [Tissierellia bacterium]|nr:U32 family peptidase [Tissierellia bacterium]